ncbi:hypoxanthine phosphoribosyltransferase [Paucilactobacillus wasatchensis]|uniref:Hypoxanthine phosphoribosyltransferase n=1 Tax=Paucilactobacillus wasatchensis TaxID=1335616 RepID=A0A0D1ABZ1_9LACO|nr:hypoxanthine phosphoribosyltransferase [Paucilactobacillus wasatchensis]KIS04191.1 Hypoxanthine-guanine phosphoribosyltransferase [Paucilactobacillus wasatchensis]
MDNDIERILYSRDDIAKAAKRLGKQLTNDFQDKRPIIISVLKGAILFTVDVIKEMDVYAEIDFIDVASYHGGTQSSGEIDLVRDIGSDIAGRNILIIEDIIDTGRTLKYLIDLLKSRNAAEIKVCTLLDKEEGRLIDVKADYVGFSVPNEFVVGYGLDYQELYRNLPYVGVLKPSVYTN